MPKEHEHSAYRFHTDLFLSGLEHIILASRPFTLTLLKLINLYIKNYLQISRKASTTYYPNLHLELARYIPYATRSGYELPYTVARLIGMPPAAHAKNPQATNSGRNTPARRQSGTPTKRSGPSLPSPRTVEPMTFD